MILKRQVKFSQRKSGKVYLEIVPNTPTIPDSEAAYRQQNRGLTKRTLGTLVGSTSKILNFIDTDVFYRIFLAAVVGFGLGYGVSVTMINQPDVVQAIPDIDLSEHRIVAEKIRVPRLDVVFVVEQGEVQDLMAPQANSLVHLSKSGSLESRNTAILTHSGLVSGKTKKLEDIEISDLIIVAGSNGANYSYRVTSIVQAKSDELPSNIEHASEELILYLPQNFLRSELLIVKARAIRTGR